MTTSWQSESLPVSLSASQSWHTESLPVSLGPESWQQIAMDPEEVKSLDSNGAGEKSENNSSNSDIVHVEKEEVPEGVEEVAAVPGVSPAGQLQEPLPRGPAPLLLRAPATALLEAKEPNLEVMAAEEAGPAPPGLPELGGDETSVVGLRAASEPAAGEHPAGEGRAVALSEGRAILLLGGAAALALLAVAVGVALALRKK